MSVAWTIVGEAGKTLNATSRSLETLQIEEARLDFRSVDTDELALTISPEDVTTALLPELGQTITLFRNGTRFFHGYVVDRPVQIGNNAQTVSVVVAGPWWWLDRINLTSTKTDDTGATAERLSYVFGTAAGGVNLKTAIEALMDRAIALGAPFQRGTVATFFDVPRITLNQCTCAQALSELVRLVPDTMAWFDYSTTPPTFNVTRRSVATVETLAIGTSPIESISIRPVWEMKVDQVRLPYITRNVTGARVFNEQASGTSATGRVHMLTVSGPELDTFLPRDLFDSVQCTAGGGIAGSIAYAIDSAREFIRKYGTNPINASAKTATAVSYWANGQGLTVTNYNVLPSVLPSGYDGVFFGPEQGDSPPDWLIEQAGLIKYIPNGDIWGSDPQSPSSRFDFDRRQLFNSIFGTETYWFQNYPAGPGTDMYSTKAFRGKGLEFWIAPTSFTTTLICSGACRTNAVSNAIALPLTFSNVTDYYVGVTVTWTKTSGVVFTDEITAYNGSTKVATLSKSWATNRPTTSDTFVLSGFPVFRSEDYTFIAPTASLAANLKAAQDFIPYSGTIELTEQDAGGTRYRGKTINISGSFTEYASMLALVESESLDLKSGQTSVNLGTPPRLDFRSFTDKIRRTPTDNFEYVT
jgi:hypothetical protein